MWTRRTDLTALLLALALGCAVASGDDARAAPEDPDPGFLEFLGSVDRLAEMNPDYLSQAEAKAAKPGARPAATPPPSPPPPPPQAPPPSASNPPQRMNNE
jgi:hypothetical protein